ncbi:MAG: PpiC-type peptidyl-prolyl cis-trans isomerase [bacterium]|nr:MAG: PpiC-type peptidyl-prolyl cis-trans isomerase [bacterium]KAF0147556.1 MAG: PpiC-type peptidyl-prolyl cis-trans isomerase [bacterium]KAF0169413.1 MAG: PpiC-type peptidyl-prolyl cis-trans isomerase [bacterium]TXT16279.1 MAG: PpiC-type peptidyl-prolyl cis-trans isomerase [bacterium]
MLEAIRERAQGWIAKVILGLLIIPFAFWGIDSYFSGGGQEPPAAEIDDHPITQREFANTLQEQREALGGRVEEGALRKMVMDQLVNTRVLSLAAGKAGFSILEPQIQAVLGGLEIFQENGAFSQTRMDAWLRNRGLSQGELIAMISQDMLLRQVQIGYGEGALVPRPVSERMARLLAEQREVREAAFDANTYIAAVKIDEAAIEADYKARQQDYTTPDQVRVQFLVLSQAQLESAVAVSEAQARAHYEANAARYAEPEQRRAAHILIKVDAGADEKTRQTARDKAELLLAELRDQPGKFAELARKHSQDPGSGAKGGDLGAFSREMMVKPFADAVWGMKPGEIRGLVESQFGYHIIRLDGVVGGAKLGFEVVKEDIRRELREQESQRRFLDSAERFSNLVYEQPDNLEPAAKEFGLKLEESGWIAKGQTVQPAVLGNPRLMEALFSEDALRKRQNTEAIEVAANTLVAARVLEHRPPGLLPLADVAADIRARLTRAAAGKLAVEAGTKALAAVQAGQADVNFSAPMTVSRMRPLELQSAAVRAIFAAPADKLPTHVGVESPEGYRLYRVSRVVPVEPAAEQAEKIRVDLRRLLAQEEMRAYLESAKAKASIKIAQTALDAKAE